MTDTTWMRVRAATLDDAAGIAVLIEHLGYPTEPAAMRSRLARIVADPDHATLVLEDEAQRVIGVAGVRITWGYTHDEPYARLLVLVVEPGRRGEGAGATLLAAVEEWARARGAASLHLTTAAHRAEAHAFYRRLGFSATGARFVRRFSGA